AHVQSELGGACAEVDRNQRLAGDGCRIKSAQAGLDHARPGQVSGKGRTVVEDRVCIQVSTGDDVIRRARICDQERTHTETARKAYRPAEKQAIAHVIACASIISLDAYYGIRREV